MSGRSETMQISQTLNLVRAGCSLCEKQLGYWSSTALALIQKDQAEYLYRMALDRKFRTPAKNGDGGGCFPPQVITLTDRQEKSADIISMKPF
jgi:hypothetical protein